MTCFGRTLGCQEASYGSVLLEGTGWMHSMYLDRRQTTAKIRLNANGSQSCSEGIIYRDSISLLTTSMWLLQIRELRHEEIQSLAEVTDLSDGCCFDDHTEVINTMVHPQP